MVHPERNCLVAPQRNHVQRRQVSLARQAHRRDDGGGHEQQPGLRPAERRLGEPEQNRELAGAGFKLHELRERADHHRQHEPHQQQEVHVLAAAAEQPAMESPGVAQHQQHGQEKIAVRAQRHQALRSHGQDHQGLQEQVDRLIAHDGRREDPIAGKRLEHDRRPRDADAADDHRRQPAEPLRDDVIEVQAGAEEQKSRRQREDRGPDHFQGNGAHHLRFHKMSPRNRAPPMPPAVRPMGTSNGCISTRPRMSHKSSSDAPARATTGKVRPRLSP